MLIATISIAVSIFLIRNTIFAYYAIYVFTISLSIFTTLGYTYQLLIPGEPELIRHVSAFSSTLATIFFILYVNDLFDAKKYFNTLYKICLSQFHFQLMIHYHIFVNPKLIQNGTNRFVILGRDTATK